MKTSYQILIAAGLIVGAAAIVALDLNSEGTDVATQDEAGHDHAAMTAGSGSMQPVVMDDEAARRIGVTLAAVERRVLPGELRSVGTVVYDETRLATVNPKIEGWVETLHIDFTGAPVVRGEPLMAIYSPALVAAQEELILAARVAAEAEGERARTTADQMLAAARRRLAYWDVPQAEIERIEEAGVPDRTITLDAPATGVVVEKNVVEGDRIVPGQAVYRIADLSLVWIEAEVYEKDLSQVGLGQHAEVTFEAYPGRLYDAVVTYMHPTVSIQSRTARVRLEVPNPREELKPGMYAQLAFHALPAPPTLVVPRSAVVTTGQRTLVFVSEGPALLPREVVPGRSVGQLVEILQGVEEGERVVSSAAFLIDAESNLGTMTGAVPEGEAMDMATSGADSAGAVDHSAHNR
ncbi:MAG: efflux RND transporter periplasmic adaptor subunit [Gemmatimonadota bacterium]|nr:efflux RND transporter periplasmic adaptor subunit [Gemmatimonadota bacterium]